MMLGGPCLCTRILQVEGLELSSLESAINSRTGMIEPSGSASVVASPVHAISASLLSLPNLCFITCALFLTSWQIPRRTSESKPCTNWQSIENKERLGHQTDCEVGEITWIWGIW